MESSGTIYKIFSKELGSKGKKSLINVKAACDLIESTKGVMNYSSVGCVSTKHYGGPKKQSIQNNNNLKRYIDARIREYKNQYFL